MAFFVNEVVFDVVIIVGLSNANRELAMVMYDFVELDINKYGSVILDKQSLVVQQLKSEDRVLIVNLV